jgi:hypothetical protein
MMPFDSGPAGPGRWCDAASTIPGMAAVAAFWRPPPPARRRRAATTRPGRSPPRAKGRPAGGTYHFVRYVYSNQAPASWRRRRHQPAGHCRSAIGAAAHASGPPVRQALGLHHTGHQSCPCRWAVDQALHPLPLRVVQVVWDAACACVRAAAPYAMVCVAPSNCSRSLSRSAASISPAPWAAAAPGPPQGPTRTSSTESARPAFGGMALCRC